MNDDFNLLVISGFPGVGKSYMHRKYGWHDSDLSKFSLLSPGVLNPEFPDNYIKHIKGLTGNVMVSTHLDVRDALVKSGIRYFLVYPSLGCKDEYLQRYRDRGSPQKFIDLIDKQWSIWIPELMDDTNAFKHFVLKSGEYMSTIFGETC